MNNRRSEYNLRKSLSKYIYEYFTDTETINYVGESIDIYNFDEMPSGMTELSKENTVLVWKVGKTQTDAREKRGYYKYNFLVHMLALTRIDAGNSRMLKLSDAIRDAFFINSNIQVLDYISGSLDLVNSMIILAVYDNYSIKELSQGFKMRELIVHLTMPI